MRTIIAVIASLATLITVAVSMAEAQGAAAASFADTPSSLRIERHFLEQRQARLERELRVVTRCINFASQHLLDTQGNVNQLARTDLVNCNRRLQLLQRQVAILTRLGQRLEFNLRAEILARLQQAAEAQIQATSGNQ